MSEEIRTLNHNIPTEEGNKQSENSLGIKTITISPRQRYPPIRTDEVSVNPIES